MNPIYRQSKPKNNPSSIYSTGFPRFGCRLWDGVFYIGNSQVGRGNGRVIAADLQPQMLAGLQKRATRADLQSRITPHICLSDGIDIPEPIDMVNAFWMIHEVPNRKAFLQEIFSGLNHNGILLIVEPFIHVTAKNFNRTVDLCNETGFTKFSHPHISFSRAVVFLK